MTIQNQEQKSIELKAREIALGDEGYFAFHFQVKRIFASSSYLDALLAGQ